MNEKLLAGLRDMIAFVASNPEFDFEHSSAIPIVDMQFSSWYVPQGSDPKDTVKRLARRAGSLEKQYSENGEFIWLRHQFGPYVRFTIATKRSVICERIVTGTKIVPATKEIVLPATPERTEEVVEWRCGSVLADEPMEVA